MRTLFFCSVLGRKDLRPFFGPFRDPFWVISGPPFWSFRDPHLDHFGTPFGGISGPPFWAFRDPFSGPLLGAFRDPYFDHFGTPFGGISGPPFWVFRDSFWRPARAPNHFPGEYHEPSPPYIPESTTVFGAGLRKCPCGATTTGIIVLGTRCVKEVGI